MTRRDVIAIRVIIIAVIPFWGMIGAFAFAFLMGGAGV